MKRAKRLAIEHECGRLALLFARHADSGDAAAMAGLFTHDCEFARPFQPDHPFYGRAAVERVFRDRPPILVRHIVTNVLVEVIDKYHARGTNYLTMLSCHASPQPPQEAGALYVGGFEDDYVRTEDGWKFARRAGMIALHLGGAMPNLPPPSDEARGIKRENEA